MLQISGTVGDDDDICRPRLAAASTSESAAMSAASFSCSAALISTDDSPAAGGDAGWPVTVVSRAGCSGGDEAAASIGSHPTSAAKPISPQHGCNDRRIACATRRWGSDGSWEVGMRSGDGGRGGEGTRGRGDRCTAREGRAFTAALTRSMCVLVIAKLLAPAWSPPHKRLVRC